MFQSSSPRRSSFVITTQRSPTHKPQRSRFSQMNIQVPESLLANNNSNTSSISTITSPEEQSLSSLPTSAQVETPIKSVRFVKAQRHMSFSGTLVTKADNSPSSLPSIVKARKFSVFGSIPSNGTDFSAQTPESTRHLPSLSLSLDQKKEESELRQTSTQKEAGELKTMKIIDKQAAKSHTSAQIMQDSEKAFELADRVLGAYGIHVRLHTIHTSDSAMIIMPVVEQRPLANFYKMFIPEVRRFNYIFLSHIHLGAISVCSSLHLSNKKYSPILDQKLHRGLFVLDKLPDRKSVQQHWFRVIIYHFLKTVPEFYQEWANLILEDSKVSSKASPFEELLVSFNHLMGTSQDSWENDIYKKTRVNFISEALKGFCFNSEDAKEEEVDDREVLRLLHLL